MISWDNFQHCIRTLISVKNYSKSRWVNKLYTRISCVLFIGKFWRKGDFILLYASFAALIFSSSSMLLDVNGNLIWNGLAVIVFLLSIVVFLRQVFSFHKSANEYMPQLDLNTEDVVTKVLGKLEKRENGPDIFPIYKTRQINAQSTPAGNENEEGYINELVNVIEFDLEISQLLLDQKEKLITIEKNEKGSLIHFPEKEIHEDSKEHRATQIKALEVLRLRAVENGTSFFNAQKVSLGKIGIDDGKLSCQLGRTSYFSSAVTNDLSTKIFYTRNGVLESESPLEIFPKVEKGEKFIPTSIDDTVGLSNHIGSVVLAISSDKVPILCIQNRNASVSAGMSVLSGAGSLEYEDLSHSAADKTENLIDLVRYGMTRELLEETGGINQDSLRKQDQVRIKEYSGRMVVAGFYRDFRRGGFPIFIGFCKMEAGVAKIRSRRTEAICLWKSAVETDIDHKPAKTTINNAKEMVEYIETYIETHGNPSDQVLIIKELLGLEAVASHFDTIINYEQANPAHN